MGTSLTPLDTPAPRDRLLGRSTLHRDSHGIASSALKARSSFPAKLASNSACAYKPKAYNSMVCELIWQHTTIPFSKETVESVLQESPLPPQNGERENSAASTFQLCFCAAIGEATFVLARINATLTPKSISSVNFFLE
jgi:hypothetical protein